MASIHVFYDPHDKIDHDLRAEKRFEISSAHLHVGEDHDKAHLEGLLVSLAALLMAQVWK